MKSLRLKAILVSTLLTTCQLWAADGDRDRGGESGGGGSAVKCKDGKMYSLDYLLTQRPANEEQFPPEIANAKDEKEILLAIAENLKQKIPNLGLALEKYTKSLYSQSSPDQIRYWSPSEHQLIATNDQNIIKNLTQKCGPAVNAKTKKIILEQAVVRSPVSGFTIDSGVNKKGEIIKLKSAQYTFDYSVLNSLRDNGPIQLSYLLLHEFFRDFTGDVNVMYRLSHFLHHSFHLSDVEVYNNLVALGLSNNRLVEERFFDLERHVLFQKWTIYRDSLKEIESKFVNFAKTKILSSLQDLTARAYRLEENFDPVAAAALKGSVIGLISLYRETQQEALGAFEAVLKNRPADLPEVISFYRDRENTRSDFLDMYRNMKEVYFYHNRTSVSFDSVMVSDAEGYPMSKLSDGSLHSYKCYRTGLLEPVFCFTASLLLTIERLEKENAPKEPEKKSSYFWQR